MAGEGGHQGVLYKHVTGNNIRIQIKNKTNLIETITFSYNIYPMQGLDRLNIRP